MRAIGLDIGERRVGVAVSDPTRRVATPAKALDAAALSGAACPLAALIREYEATTVLVGLPLTMSGEEGPQALRVREIASRLADELDVELAFIDERLSTAEASRALRASGKDTRRRDGSVDSAAATVLLQTWMDAARNADTCEQE